jgi:hypothetical protein
VASLEVLLNFEALTYTIQSKAKKQTLNWT